MTILSHGLGINVNAWIGSHSLTRHQWVALDTTCRQTANILTMLAHAATDLLSIPLKALRLATERVLGSKEALLGTVSILELMGGVMGQQDRALSKGSRERGRGGGRAHAHHGTMIGWDPRHTECQNGVVLVVSCCCTPSSAAHPNWASQEHCQRIPLAASHSADNQPVTALVHPRLCLSEHSNFTSRDAALWAC